MSEQRVLVVDDDQSTREGLAELLTCAGFTVEQATDGQMALKKLDLRDFGVLLLDVQLPGVGGLEILARCCAKHVDSKIIVMTGVDTTETLLAALRGQAWEFMPKPIDPARLVDSVKRALSARNSIVDPIEVISASPEWLELLVPCTREAVNRIQSFVQSLEMDLPAQLRDSVGLAFHELLMNGIEWGGQLNPKQRVRVACIRTERILVYRVNDPGQGFKWHDLTHAASHHPAGEAAHDDIRREKGLRPGGFGLVLIRAIADELIYNEQRNEVLFVKYLDGTPIPPPSVSS